MPKFIDQKGRMTVFPLLPDDWKGKELPFERAEWLRLAEMFELYFEGGIVVSLTPAEMWAWAVAMTSLVMASGVPRAGAADEEPKVGL